MPVIRFFTTEAGRSQPLDFLKGLPERDRAFILADIDALVRYGFNAPISVKSIGGHSPMREIRTLGFRTFFVTNGQTIWILGCCKKEHQKREIKAAARRMKQLE